MPSRSSFELKIYVIYFQQIQTLAQIMFYNFITVSKLTLDIYEVLLFCVPFILKNDFKHGRFSRRRVPFDSSLSLFLC